MVHCGVIRQSAKMIKIEKKAKPGKEKVKKEGSDDEVPEESLLRAGDTGLVRMKFIGNPEIIRVGQKIVFREARTKGVGDVVEVFPMTGDENKKEKKQKP